MNALESRLSPDWRRSLACAAAVIAQAVCGLCISWAAASFAADQPLEDRFLKEAPAKWLEYRQIVARHTEGRAKGWFENALGQKYFFDESFTLNIDSKRARAKVVRYEKGQAKTVEAFNPEYRFRLTAGRGGQWTIDRLRPGAREIPTDLIGHDPKFPLRGEEGSFADAITPAFLGLNFEAGWFPRLVESSEFRPILVTELVGKRSLVKVEFKFEPAGPTGGIATMRSGTIVLDAKRYWLIRDVDAQATFTAGSEKRGLVPIRGTFTIRDSILDGKLLVPYVSHQVITAAGDADPEGKPWKSTTVMDVEMHDVPNIDPRQFTLSAYGLPEPPAK